MEAKGPGKIKVNGKVALALLPQPPSCDERVAQGHAAAAGRGEKAPVALALGPAQGTDPVADNINRHGARRIEVLRMGIGRVLAVAGVLLVTRKA